MNKRVRIMGTAVLAVCAVGATAGTAQGADRWFVGGVPLVGAKPVKGKSNGTVRLTVPGRGVRIVCEADTFTGKILNALTGGVNEAHIELPNGIKFTECDLDTHPGGVATGCWVASPGPVPRGTIMTNALTGKFNTNTGANKAHVLLSPAAGAVVAEIEIKGGCAFENEEPGLVTGSVEGAVIAPVNANVESHEWTVEFPEPVLAGSTLKFEGFAARFVAKEEVELEAAGEKAKLE